jgi:S1-C subfamily serine protease
MFRIGALLIVLLVPALVSAEEKEKPKASFIGVMIARGKEEGIIVVRTVINNSPAEKAGLKSGDVLKRINDVKPTTIVATVKLIRSLKPGKKVKVLIERDGKEKTLEIVPRAADE